MKKNTQQDRKENMRALVVFSDHTDLLYLKGLKSGFRHCFVFLYDGQGWVSVDPLANYMQVLMHHALPENFDMPTHLKAQGFQVIETHLKVAKSRTAPPMFFTCVEAVKRVLGLHKPLIFTPWQLFKFLNQQNQTLTIKKEITHGKSILSA